MRIDRRKFLKAGGLGLAAMSLQPLAPKAAAASKATSFVQGVPKMHLGLVTYNLAQDWDVPTIIKICEATKLEGVELRTTHAHKTPEKLRAKCTRR